MLLAIIHCRAESFGSFATVKLFLFQILDLVISGSMDFKIEAQIEAKTKIFGNLIRYIDRPWKMGNLIDRSTKK